MEWKKMLKISGIVLATILVLGAFVYVGISEWNKYIYNVEVKAAQTGYSIGQQDLSKQMIASLSQCQSLTGKTADNQTITIIAQECLKQPAK